MKKFISTIFATVIVSFITWYSFNYLLLLLMTLHLFLKAKFGLWAVRLIAATISLSLLLLSYWYFHRSRFYSYLFLYLSFTLTVANFKELMPETIAYTSEFLAVLLSLLFLSWGTVKIIRRVVQL